MNKSLDLTKIMVNKNNSALGKGLSALLGDVPNNLETKNLHISENKNTIVNIDLSLCVPSTYQARKTFVQEELQHLADSIKSNGVIQPILLRKLNQQYEIVAGERRCRAAKLAGFTTIPAIVMDINDKDVMEIGLIENLQRQNLNPQEEALAYQQLIKTFGYTHEEVAKTVGKSRSYITNYLRILQLPNDIQQMIVDGKLSAGHAKILVSVDNPQEIAQQILNNSFSVRETEELIKQRKNSSNTQHKDNVFIPELMMWHNKVNMSYSYLKIKIQPKDLNSGEIKIKYDDINELKKILNIY